MDSIQDMLLKKSPQEPAQVAALIKYVQDNYEEKISVRTSQKNYLITVPGASLAQKLRIDSASIIDQCNLDKRLVIHIGH